MRHGFAVPALFPRTALLALACLALTVPVFAKMKIFSQTGKTANFAGYKTYQWLPTKILTNMGVVENDPAADPIIRKAVNAELIKLGMVEVKEGGDLQVATFVLTESVPQLEAVIYTAPIYYDWESQPVTMGRYNKEGTMVVNLIDPKTKKSAWSAMAKDSLNTKKGANTGKVAKAAQEMFKKYPTAAKTK